MFLITWLLGGTVPSKRTIKQYEYKSPPLSLFERLFLDKFWTALPGTIYPPWLAPNVITLAGLVCIIVAIALVLHHSPALDGAAPTGVYAAVGVLIFLYQTLDGSDGKQARSDGHRQRIRRALRPRRGLHHRGLNRGVRAGRGPRSYTDETLWLSVAASTCTFYLSNCSLVAFGRQQFFDVDVQELIVCLTVLCLYCGVVGATSAPRWMITGSLCCMVLNCLQLIWKLRDTEYLGRRCKALAAIAGGVAINAATIKQVSKEPFVATVPLVCCIAAAAGDLSRRLLLQRVADLPEIVDFLTPTGLLLWALALWPGRTRVVAAAASLAFYGVAASRTVVATAGALGVRAITNVRRSSRVRTGAPRKPHQLRFFVARDLGRATCVFALACSLAPLSRIELEARNSSTSTQGRLHKKLDDGQQLDDVVELRRGVLQVRERTLVVPRCDIRARPRSLRPFDSTASFTRSFASLYVSAYSIAAPIKSSPQSFSNFWKVIKLTAYR